MKKRNFCLIFVAIVFLFLLITQVQLVQSETQQDCFCLRLSWQDSSDSFQSYKIYYSNNIYNILDKTAPFEITGSKFFCKKFDFNEISARLFVSVTAFNEIGESPASELMLYVKTLKEHFIVLKLEDMAIWSSGLIKRPGSCSCAIPKEEDWPDMKKVIDFVPKPSSLKDFARFLEKIL